MSLFDKENAIYDEHLEEWLAAGQEGWWVVIHHEWGLPHFFLHEDSAYDFWANSTYGPPRCEEGNQPMMRQILAEEKPLMLPFFGAGYSAAQESWDAKRQELLAAWDDARPGGNGKWDRLVRAVEALRD